jgi:hypothetical protein
MGRQSRRKRAVRADKAEAKPPSPLREVLKTLPPRQQFQVAMASSAVEAIHAGGRACFLCGSPARHAGVFQPTTDEMRRRLKSPPGTLRVAAYAFCDACDGADLPARVEAAIRERYPLESTP